MSDTSQNVWIPKLRAVALTPEQQAYIDAHNAELEAKAAAREAAARQEQKDIIKEAILEALREYGAAQRERLTFLSLPTDKRLNVR